MKDLSLFVYGVAVGLMLAVDCFGSQSYCSTCQQQSYIPYTAPTYSTYAAPTTLYGVAPWLQAQAADQYKFTGSKERLELEYLRGYVVAQQQTNSTLQQQTATLARLIELQTTPEGETEDTGQQGQPAGPGQPTVPMQGQAGPQTGHQPPQPPSPQQGQAGPPQPPSPQAMQAAAMGGAAVQPQPQGAITRPLTQMYCAHCHNQEKQSGKLWIDNYVDMAGPDNDIKRGKIARALKENKMPLGPDGNPLPIAENIKGQILLELAN